MCKIDNCFNESLTSDGYCLKHKNFTLTDYKVINDYVARHRDQTMQVVTLKWENNLQYTMQYHKIKNIILFLQ